MLYTPFVATPHNYYTVATQGINLGGKKLVINPVSAAGQMPTWCAHAAGQTLELLCPRTCMDAAF